MSMGSHLISKSAGEEADIFWRCIGHRGVPYATYGALKEVAYGPSRLLTASEPCPPLPCICQAEMLSDAQQVVNEPNLL